MATYGPAPGMRLQARTPRRQPRARQDGGPVWSRSSPTTLGRKLLRSRPTPSDPEHVTPIPNGNISARAEVWEPCQPLAGVESSDVGPPGHTMGAIGRLRRENSGLKDEHWRLGKAR